MKSRSRLSSLALFFVVSAGLVCNASCTAQPEANGQVGSARAMNAPAIPQAGTVDVPRGGKKEPLGYYRMPAIHGEWVAFVSEGDLWKVPTTGGKAQRMTSHHGIESNPVISPDGKTVAFTAQYEGPSELYTMPMEGGLPTRLTYDGWSATPVTWTPDGRIVFATSLYSTLPNSQLVILDPATGQRERIPLWQASAGTYDDKGETLYFHVLGQGSHTKRYKGGTAQQIWKFGGPDSSDEALPLTEDYPGTNKDPMWWNGRVYFATDRDGTMNIWSMNEDGGDLKQHTHHVGWEVQSPSLYQGRIAYQYGADIRVYDIANDTDSLVPISLETDFDQMREKWINNPMGWTSDAHLSDNGEYVVLTARGEVFVTPPKQGRLIEVTRDPGVRYRDARFMTGEGNENRLLVLSDESGEVELWTLPADGMGERKQLTSDASVLRWTAVPSPDGKWIAHTDKNWRLWMYNVETGANTLVDTSDWDDITGLTWSPDSRWLAYQYTIESWYLKIRLYNVETQTITDATSERFSSYSPAWDPDGKWLYFLSDRRFRSLQGSPWGVWQPEPFFDETTRLYAVALQKNLRSPFAPENELTRAEAKAKAKEKDRKKKPDEQEPEKTEEPDKHPDQNVDQPDEPQPDETKPADQPDDEAGPQDKDNGEGDNEKADEKEKKVEIDLDGLADRLYDVPVGPGNYNGLFVAAGHLYWIDRGNVGSRSRDLKAMKITNESPDVKTIADGVEGVELSGDGKKLLIRKGNALYIVSANGNRASLNNDSQVDLGGWAFSLIPREEWRQMFVEAWRLERDYFYDQNMHGVDWPAMLDRYIPLVDRVSDRDELADAIAQMVSELSALHIFVYGGDTRRGEESISTGSLGAFLVRDETAGGYRIETIYEADPDYPNLRSPLAQLDQDIEEGDVIVKVNGIDALSVHDISELLRNQIGKQVLLHVRKKGGDDENEAAADADDADDNDTGGDANGDGDDDDLRKYIVEPISQGAARNLRYHEWEYTRRLIVEDKSDDQIGYIHLRAMGSGDIADWTRDYQPIFRRKGLIIDVRHNGGGNIDSWILNRLIRKAWFYWQGRVGKPYWNMQGAFRGHMVILCDENTGSDGEAITEGFRRLGLGPVIGKRTWGGEIWLSSSNRLVDRGIATAAEFGVYGPEGVWLIEGWGVEPDYVVDNPLHATYNGADAQLDFAIDYLLKKIAEEPRDVPPAPPHPDKSSPDNRK